MNAALGALNFAGVRYSLLAIVGPYPSYVATGYQSQYFGWTEVYADPDLSNITVFYNLTNLPPSSYGGMHIHTGMSCSDASVVGGHYWTPATDPDPWNINAMWFSDANGNAVGNFTVSTGYQYAGNLRHALVTHLANGTRFGCGVLDA